MNLSSPPMLDTESTNHVSSYADPLTTPKATVSNTMDMNLDGALAAMTFATSSAAVSSAMNIPSGRSSAMSALHPVDTHQTIPEGIVPSSLPATLSAHPSLSTYPSPSLTPLKSVWSDRAMSDHVSERSPSPHTRLPHPNSMAEALAASKSPGLIRRMSRGAHNRLRRRASTTQSMRMRDQSAGPVLMRRRSDSNGASDYGQDMSDLELDSAAEDVSEEAPYPFNTPDNSNGLGINTGRTSNDSNRSDGDQAPVDPSILQVGTVLVKLTRSKRKTMKFWLDTNSARVCWHLTNPLKSFFIDDVTRVEAGTDSRHMRDDIQVSPTEENLMLTIVYHVPERSKGRTIKTMHLLMPDLSIMTMWRNALDSVVRERITKMNALSLSTEKSERSMAVLWQQTMLGRNEQLFTLDDARRLCRTLQINCNDSTIVSHFQNADTENFGVLDFARYRDFINTFKKRNDIQHLYRNLRHGTDLDLTIDDFFAFLRDNQAINVEQDRAHWESVFERFSKLSPVKQIMTDPMPTSARTMNSKGFQNFLLSSYNSPLILSKADVTLDRPLNEYFISSSHNTYLLGRQFAGESSVEGYICALIKGCRCIEIDCWDGDNGRPVVTHGRTMTTKVLFEDCVSVIEKYAFHSTPYPLIVSLEVHCNPEQQATMVDIMIKHWHDVMVTEPISSDTRSLPSPEDLRYRILVKVKKASATVDNGALFIDMPHGRSRAQSLGSTIGSSFSSAIVRSPSTDRPPLPSIIPSSLVSSPATTSPSEPMAYAASTPRGSTTSGPTLSPSSSADDSDTIAISADRFKKKKLRTSKIIPKLGQLGVYAQGIKYVGYGFDSPLAQTYNHIFSFGEPIFSKICRKSSNEKALLELHNTQYLMRVYPAARRLDSSNFNPLQAWRRGVQMAALNWQTYDVHQQVNEAMFAAGSDHLGYVLKPEELRHPKHSAIADMMPQPFEKKEKRDKKIVRFSVDIISAQRLPRPWNQKTEAGMNPYIEFEMYSAEDKAPGVAVGEGGTDASARDGSSGIGQPLRKRTKVAAGNGFDPTFHEPINMTVRTKYPSMIFVRWTVWNSSDSRRPSSNVLLGSFTAKLSTLQQGYRHLPLFNPQGEQYQDAKLFVRIRKQTPVPIQQLDSPYVSSDQGGMSPSIEPIRPIRADRSWPRRIFSRTPSQARRPQADYQSNNGDQASLMSRTSSLDRGSTQ
ncbi:1-phosphatidylinositol-4,5-bisphosphate phosphodiesterase 1 like protein [Acrodontium crateriforme]|uniref:Phosphoinositide phospholipase C n=1 Tax=Acrodontium crateriforme TaxID=150365 RepID=A0AAQ3M951_9PEZI|nr:1-phosphatidylinositol-4,5-bisphosphate phosphodiesterase 1 like protein [Acrodontium crateriforme]